jgi:hypothetical protein
LHRLAGAVQNVVPPETELRHTRCVCAFAASVKIAWPMSRSRIFDDNTPEHFRTRAGTPVEPTAVATGLVDDP